MALGKNISMFWIQTSKMAENAFEYSMGSVKKCGRDISHPYILIDDCV